MPLPQTGFNANAFSLLRTYTFAGLKISRPSIASLSHKNVRMMGAASHLGPTTDQFCPIVGTSRFAPGPQGGGGYA